MKNNEMSEKKTFRKKIIALSDPPGLLALFSGLSYAISVGLASPPFNIVRKLSAVYIVMIFPGYVVCTKVLKIDDSELYWIPVSVISITFGFTALDIFTGLPWYKNIVPLTIVIHFVFLTVYSLSEDSEQYQWQIPWKSTVFSTAVLLTSITAAVTPNHGIGEGLVTLSLLLIAVSPAVLIHESKNLPSVSFSIPIYIISLSVLYQTSLVTKFAWGWDINYIIYLVSSVLAGGWDPSFTSSINTLLTSTVFPSVLSTTAGVDVAMAFKGFYPLIYAVLPVGIYKIARSKFDKSVALLTPFMLIFYYGYFKFIPTKQAIAEVYFALLILLLVSDVGDSVGERVLTILMFVGMTISHYAVSIIFLVIFVAHIISTLPARGSIAEMRRDLRLLSLFAVPWLGWYMYVSGGTRLVDITVIVIETGSSIIDGSIFTVQSRSGVDYATTGPQSLLWAIYRYLYFAIVGAMGISMLDIIRRMVKREKINRIETLGLGMFGFLSVTVLFPLGIGFDRVFKTALVVLAPFALFGIKSAWNSIRFISRTERTNSKINIYRLMTTLSIIVFLFSSGLAFHVSGQSVPEYSINLDQDAGWPVYAESEIEAVHWIDENIDVDESNIAVYNRWDATKSRDGALVSQIKYRRDIEGIWEGRTELPGNSYVYTSSRPMRMPGSSNDYISIENTSSYASFARSGRIYHSGTAEVRRVN